jgi:hypothetical protein
MKTLEPSVVPDLSHLLATEPESYWGIDVNWWSGNGRTLGTISHKGSLYVVLFTSEEVANEAMDRIWKKGFPVVEMDAAIVPVCLSEAFRHVGAVPIGDQVDVGEYSVGVILLRSFDPRVVEVLS